MTLNFSVFVVFLIIMGCQKDESQSQAPSTFSMFATPGPCSNALASLPAYEDSLDMFTLIYNSYKKDSACLNDSYGDVHDLVILSVDKKWNDLPNLDRLMKNDIAFKNFIITSLNSMHTEFLSSLKAIVKKSEKDCPPSLKSLCLELKNSAKTAIHEEEEYRLAL